MSELPPESYFSGLLSGRSISAGLLNTRQAAAGPQSAPKQQKPMPMPKAPKIPKPKPPQPPTADPFERYVPTHGKTWEQLYGQGYGDMKHGAVHRSYDGINYGTWRELAQLYGKTPEELMHASYQWGSNPDEKVDAVASALLSDIHEKDNWENAQEHYTEGMRDLLGDAPSARIVGPQRPIGQPQYPPHRKPHA